MKKTLKYVLPLLTICSISLFACTEQTTTTQEKTEITTMDSTAAKAKEVSDQLEAQTKAVEESIEKLDDKFSSGK